MALTLDTPIITISTASYSVQDEAVPNEFIAIKNTKQNTLWSTKTDSKGINTNDTPHSCHFHRTVQQTRQSVNFCSFLFFFFHQYEFQDQNINPNKLFQQQTYYEHQTRGEGGHEETKSGFDK